MWIRDLLPNDQKLQRCRLMLFGYTSALLDKKKANDRLVDYADTLLRELQLLRKSPVAAKRPLIFVCHSMGGLLARLAVTRLSSRPREFEGLCPYQCGLLFLSTPHFGSRIADWNEFWVQLGASVGVRADIVKGLQTLNISVVDVLELWNEMKEPPVVKCLCEGEETEYSILSIFPRRKLVRINRHSEVTRYYAD